MKQLYAYALALLFLCTYPTLVKSQCAQPGKDGNIAGLNYSPNTYYSPAAASFTLTKNVTNSISLGAAGIVASSGITGISPGDLVLIAQMQGTDISSTNDANYGSNSGAEGGYLNNANLEAGYYEYAVAAAGTNVTAAAGGTLNLSQTVKNTYLYANATATAGQYRYQVIKVLQYLNCTLSGNITTPAWNGAVGGISALDVKQTLTMAGFSISADGKGFRGGGGRQYTGTTDAGSVNIYRYLSSVTAHASKGEGISGTPKYVYDGASVVTNAAEGYPNGSFGKGAPGNAGGGGTDNKPTPSTSADNQYNTGGGGGGNAGAGGKAGWGWSGTPGTPNTTENGGRGGFLFGQASVSRIVMGGGGGAGTANNSASTNALESSGAMGGGIIIVNANTISGAGTISANGADALNLVNSGATAGHTDAAGGGGAGGSIILFTNNGAGINGITASVKGGKGGSNYYGQHGPGGSGGGGFIYTNGTPASSSVAGGLNGQSGPGPGNNNSMNQASLDYGSVPGNAGSLVSSGGNIFPSVIISGFYCTILPISLMDFSVSPQGDHIRLSWKTAQEQNSSQFIIQYSGNGTDWFDIASVAAAGNSNTTRSYGYTQYNPAPGRNYYRLKEIDIDGQFSLSDIKWLDWKFYSEQMTVSPNPVRDQFILQLNGLRPGRYELQLINVSGQLMMQKSITLTQTNTRLVLNRQSQMGGGLYFLRLLSLENILSLNRPLVLQ